MMMGEKEAAEKAVGILEEVAAGAKRLAKMEVKRERKRYGRTPEEAKMARAVKAGLERAKEEKGGKVAGEKRKYVELRDMMEADPELGEQVYTWATQSYAYAEEQLKERRNIEVKASTISGVYHWWKTRQQTEELTRRTKAQVELLAKANPGMTPQELASAGQLLFEMEALEARNLAEFINLQKLRMAQAAAGLAKKIELAKLKLAERKMANEEAETERRAKLEKPDAAAEGRGLTEEALAEIERRANLL